VEVQAMKLRTERISLILVFVAMLITGYVGVSHCVLLDENTMGFWSFDEGDGDTVMDASGNRNDGVIDGALWIDGKYGKALEFDGKDDFAEVPDSDSLHAEDLTIAAWINVYSDPHDWGDGGAGAIVFKNNEYQWSVDVGSGAAPGLLWFGIWGAKLVSNFDFTDHLNEWHHVAVTFDGGTQECRIYVDGELDAEGTVAEQVDPQPTPVLFGSREGSGRPDVFYHGALDDIEISNVVREQAEIQASMAPLAVDTYGKLMTIWSALRRMY
jgi:hypothetical protein